VGNNNVNTFVGFLGLLIQSVGAPLTVILDNASFHKGQLV